jgi:hypothetical protein
MPNARKLNQCVQNVDFGRLGFRIFTCQRVLADVHGDLSSRNDRQGALHLLQAEPKLST